jgi:hypothetical protein
VGGRGGKANSCQFSSVIRDADGAIRDTILKYTLTESEIRDVPECVVEDIQKQANRIAKGNGELFAKTKYDLMQKWIKGQDHGAWRIKAAPPWVSSANQGGFHYVFKDSDWKKIAPRLLKVTGEGADAALRSSLARGLANLEKIGAVEVGGGKAAFALKAGGRVLLVVGIGVAVYEIGTAENKPREFTKQVGGLAGAAAGAAVGAKALGLVGTFVEPGGGTLIGGAIGGIIGGIGGFIVGSEATVFVYDKLEDGFLDPAVN